MSLSRQNNTLSLQSNLTVSSACSIDQLTVNEKLKMDGAATSSLVIPVYTANPSNPPLGFMYYRSGNSRLYIFNGSSWKYLQLV